jgi:hypothetical protein
MLRGIRFRAGRSLLVLLIATVSTAAAVVATGYLRAAQQSVLTDGLRSAPAYATDLVVGATGKDSDNTPGIDNAHLAVNQALAARPGLTGHLGRPIAAADTDTLMTGSSGAAMARLAYRESVCAHVRLQGDCPASEDQVMVSARSAQDSHIDIGDHVTVTFDVVGRSSVKPSARTAVLTVVGLYTVTDPTDPYWGANAYFTNGADPTGIVPRRMDAVFTPSEQVIRTDPVAEVRTHLEIGLRADSVRVDQVTGLRADLTAFSSSVKAGGLTLNTGLPQVLDGVATSQRDLSHTVPVVAVPLLLLCLFVLFLVVAALIEERSPEIALAKLRGFGSSRASRFGVAEVLLLIAIAAPLGVLLGLVLVEVAATTLLASGTHVEARWTVFVAGIAAMSCGALAATFAARRTLARGVLGLLRRVPEQRTGWRANVGEMVALVAVAASLVAAYENRTSALALAAAPLLALVAGLVAARLLAISARMSLASAHKHGRIVGMLAGARLSRQPGRHRVIVVVTVAVSLLVFGATAWDVGAAARAQHASDTLGADRVYSVLAPYPSALVAAVNAADPSGHSMAVVRANQTYANKSVSMLGVQPERLAKVVTWRGVSATTIDQYGTLLRPKVADTITVKDNMHVTATVTTADPGAVELDALIAAPGQPPHSVSLGTLAVGVSDYHTTTDCASGCRLLGLSLSRTTTKAGEADAELTITAIDAADQLDSTSWKGTEGLTVSGSGTDLGLKAHLKGENDAKASYVDTPASLPVVTAGGTPADDPGAIKFDFPSIGDDQESFSVVGRADRLPRVGDRGLLFDLNDAVSMAERTGTLADATNLQYEVWASADAPADLAQKLSARGISVVRTETVASDLDQLSRGAPTLGLWLYLFAGGLALLLATGVVLLGAYIGSGTRVYEYAALKVSGVRPKQLRRAVIREYRSTLGVSLVVGCIAGLAGAVLMLPSIALVTADGPVGSVPYGGRLLALPVALVAAVVAMTIVVALALRMLSRATPDRLREGTR